MSDTVQLILKVLVASTLISIAIKFGGPHLNVPATNAIALGMVLSPTLIMSGLLIWRALR